MAARYVCTHYAFVSKPGTIHMRTMWAESLDGAIELAKHVIAEGMYKEAQVYADGSREVLWDSRKVEEKIEASIDIMDALRSALAAVNSPRPRRSRKGRAA